MNKKIFMIFAIVLVIVLALSLNSVLAKAEKNQNQPSTICTDKCGDGICQEVVCQATNCPCAETKETCSKDCKIEFDEGASESEDNEDEKASKSENTNGELHRSVVANFVQSLLQVASRQEGGIGEQVRVVAQEQNQNREKTADQIESIEKRNKIKTFLIGTDYKNVGALRSEMVQTRNRLEKLNRLMEQTMNAADKTELQNQIQTLEEEQVKIETLLKKAEGKFSLFGWLVKLFRRD